MATQKISFFLSLIASMFALLAHSTMAYAEMVDRVVAVVDEDVITLAEVNEAGHQQFTKILRNNSGQEATDKLAAAQKTVLDELIDKRLIAQRAKELQISISDKKVDSAFENILQLNKISRADFLKQIAIAGRTEKQFRSSLKEQLMFNQVMLIDIRSKIVVSDSQLKTYYKAHYTKTLKPGEYHLMQIGFTWTDSVDKKEDDTKATTSDAALKQAERIRKLAMQGKDFRELARTYSELPTASDGGDIGILNKDEVSSSMAEALNGLQGGGITQVIKTGNSFQFFKILATEGDAARLVPFDSVKEEMQQKLYLQETERLYKKWIKDRREQVYIEIL